MIAPPCESAFANRIVIVLGTPRSGTTWLAQLLLSHPDLAGADAESSVFRGLRDFWANAWRADGEGLATCMERAELAAVLRQFSDRIFGGARDLHGPAATWFVEKTPDHVHRIPLMAATYPDAWYIHILRDGRDVARSHARAPFGPTDVSETARLWAWRVRVVQQQRWRLARFREVRYERLTEDPVGEVSDLLAWMGLDPDDDVRRRLAHAAGREVSTAHTSEPVGVGKWRRLAPEDLAAVYDEAGDLLAELGYLDE